MSRNSSGWRPVEGGITRKLRREWSNRQSRRRMMRIVASSSAVAAGLMLGSLAGIPQVRTSFALMTGVSSVQTSNFVVFWSQAWFETQFNEISFFESRLNSNVQNGGMMRITSPAASDVKEAEVVTPSVTHEAATELETKLVAALKRIDVIQQAIDSDEAALHPEPAWLTTEQNRLNKMRDSIESELEALPKSQISGVGSDKAAEPTTEATVGSSPSSNDATHENSNANSGNSSPSQTADSTNGKISQTTTGVTYGVPKGTYVGTATNSK